MLWRKVEPMPGVSINATPWRSSGNGYVVSTSREPWQLWGLALSVTKRAFNLLNSASVRPGEPLFWPAVVKLHPNRKLLAAVQKGWNRGQRDNGSGQDRLTKQRVDQRALSSFDLAEHSQVTAFFSQPLPQPVQPATVGLKLRTECAELVAGFFQEVGQRDGIHGRREHRLWPLHRIHIGILHDTSMPGFGLSTGLNCGHAEAKAAAPRLSRPLQERTAETAV